MVDVRRILVIFIIAILFTVFVNVSIEAVYPSPDYEDFCQDKFQPLNFKDASDCEQINVSQKLINSCREDGEIRYNYSSDGCPTVAYCESCYENLNLADEKYGLIVFLVSTIAGMIAVLIGVNLPERKNKINEWVGSGFLLGGLITIFSGTVRYFGDMGRFIKPLVIFLELALIVYLSYKKLGKK